MTNDQNVLLGDALDVLPSLAPQSVDLIIADPPYNLEKNYGNNHDILGFEEYLEFSRRWIQEAYRVLKPAGSIYVFMGFRFISYVFSILDREMNMHFNNWICWHYTQGIGKTRGFSPRHDDILAFSRSSKFTFNLDAVRVPQKYFRDRNNMRGANPGDVWNFSHVHYCNGNRQNHPTQKPEGLIERMVLAMSNEGDTVLDPFLGSGTTARVCQQLKRRCIGIELNPDYVRMANDRMQQPFLGFDSVDPRMERVPHDLTNATHRESYLQSHRRWFLGNHENTIKKFEENVDAMYGDDETRAESKQLRIEWGGD